MQKLDSWHIRVGDLYRKWAEYTYGDPERLPREYIVIDLETTGLSPINDHVAQIGCCAVTGDKVIAHSVLLETPMDWFGAGALEVNGLTEQLIKEHGQPREEAIRKFHDLLSGLIEKGLPVVGQNLLDFDLPFLETEFGRLGIEFDTPRDVLDTGILVKAAQLELEPEVGETFRTFLRRVRDIHAKGIYWSLTGFCDVQFELFDMIRNLDEESRKAVEEQAHDAGVDSLKVHLLLRRFTEIAEKINRGELAVEEEDADALFNRLDAMF